MTNRFALWQLAFILVISLECAALHDAYVVHPTPQPDIHLPSNAQIALQLAALDVSHHAILPAPRRHQ